MAKVAQVSALERTLHQQYVGLKQQNDRIELAMNQRQQGLGRRPGMGFSPAQLQTALQNQTAEMNAKLAAGIPPTQASAMTCVSTFATPVSAKPQWWLAPGNVGDINTVIWDYWFVIQPTIVAPGSSTTQILNINNVASFTLKAIMKDVSVQTENGSFLYVDPDAPADIGFAPGLQVQISDVSSARQYYNSPVRLDHVGSPQEPFILPSPLMYQPSASISVQISNSNTTDTFAVGLGFLGYRLRINNQSQLGSQITGG